MKKLSYAFAALSVILSHLMCIEVAYNYRDMLCGIEHSCYSAPAYVAFFALVPYTAGILICALASFVLHKKAK